jgi:hypothetical protein
VVLAVASRVALEQLPLTAVLMAVVLPPSVYLGIATSDVLRSASLRYSYLRLQPSFVDLSAAAPECLVVL